MSFEKHSNFNKLANFSEVKFGENKPVLEVELNEMQQIQNEARADIIRDTMPSGFVTLGEIDYDYCANNNNQIKLKTESIAYVNGYRITIPKDTIIEIGESDKVREDLVFLEVWREAVNDIDTLTEYGGENNAVINNPIKDERYPVATSQRVALKYRIRHVSDVDFNTYVLDGFTTDVNGVDGFTRNNQQVLAIGGLNPEQLTIDPNRRYFNYKQRAYSKSTNKTTYPTMATEDSGLFVAGNSNNFLNTSDGYVYAIPMFRLLRKPNVGLCTPFEYKKIHNQLDPKKFAHLVGQENVEKVHSVDIKGKTYKNLNSVVEDSYVLTAGNGAGVNKSIIKPNHYRWSKDSGNNSFYPKLGLINSSFSPNTVYTIQYTIESNINFGHGFCIAYGDAYVGKSTPDVFYNEAINYSTPKATIKRVFTTRTPTSNTSNEICIGFSSITTPNPCWCEISNLIILEGDYSHVEDLTLLPGIQSLGETNNNSITVENNLLEEGTYVHELQNHILPTHPEVTHVTWGEDVVIPPEVEIELKRGEEVIQTITQLPARLETTGEEKLHVKTMKGRTLVNCCNFAKKGLVIDKWNYFIDKQDLTQELKPSTEYTIIAFVENYRVTGTGSFIVSIQSGTDKSTVFLGNSLQITGNGVFKGKAITKDDINTSSSYTHILYTAHNPGTLSGSYDMKIMIIEGDYTNVDIPYFEGMQSVKMPVLKATGKNLCDEVFELGTITNGVAINSPLNEKTRRSVNFYDIKGVQKLTLSGTLRVYGDTTAIIFYNLNKEYISTVELPGIGGTTSVPENAHFAKIRFGDADSNINVQLEEGSTATPYEPHKSNILSTPSDLELREVGDMRDELNYLTGEVTERIGEIVLDGTQDMLSDNNGVYIQVNDVKRFLDYTGKIACDKLPVMPTYGHLAGVENGISGYTNTNGHLGKNWLYVKINNSTNKGEVKEWLTQNPVTVQYQRVTESIKTVDLTEDEYVGKSKVTYQLAEPLNYIPNGAYDEIKGDKLIKRTNKIYLDGTETWSSFRDETNTTHRISLPIEDGKPSSVCMSSHYEYGTGSTVEKVKIYMTVNANLSITVLKSDFPTVDSFKTWLSNNRPMVIYELANPIEIPLKEVSPLECDFSLNRQFKRGYENYLKELPNGVKDVVENGKVTRRIAKTTIDGNENWTHYGGTTNNTDTENTLVFMLDSCSKLNTRKSGKNNYLCKTLSILEEGVNIPDVEKSGVWLHSYSQYYNFVYIRVFKNWLPTPDVAGLKKWLNNNPLEILFEVQTPTTEELTEENCRYVPYMPLNSYVGSLYVADGINQTKFLTAFSPSEYEVQTYHRYFSNEFNVFEDTTLKKSPYGHKTYLEEVDGKYVEKFIAGLEKHEIEDLRHKVSLTGFDYSQLLQDSFLKLIKGELS